MLRITYWRLDSEHWTGKPKDLKEEYYLYMYHIKCLIDVGMERLVEDHREAAVTPLLPTACNRIPSRGLELAFMHCLLHYFIRFTKANKEAGECTTVSMPSSCCWFMKTVNIFCTCCFVFFLFSFSKCRVPSLCRRSVLKLCSNFK